MAAVGKKTKKGKLPEHLQTQHDNVIVGGEVNKHVSAGDGPCVVAVMAGRLPPSRSLSAAFQARCA